MSTVVDALTLRQRQVLELAAAGCKRDEISAQLGIAPSTVRNLLEAMRRRLNADNTTHLVALALRRGLIE